MVDIIEVSSSKCFGGLQKVFKHQSRELNCEMKFSIFLPSATERNEKLPVLYFLSGLTCTEQNMITKSGIQRHAEKHQIVVVGPDTSPRNCNVPGEDDSWDLGTGAGFYVDATQQPWNKHYRMYSYVTKELRRVIDTNFICVDGSKVGITGHSMGGHGALICFLRNPQIYKAASAFAPISNPINSSWGKRCMGAYLGPDEAAWKEYDATELVKRQPQKSTTILIDQGTKDEWMSYLVPKNFPEACKSVGQPIIYHQRDGYDHGYYFIQSFLGEHFKFFTEAFKHKI